jgi:hypothetical protein
MAVKMCTLYVWPSAKIENGGRLSAETPKEVAIYYNVGTKKEIGRV